MISNQTLRDTFNETWRYDFGFGGGSLLLDTDHRLLRLRDDERALVFEASAIKSFTIKEDSTDHLCQRKGKSEMS